MSRRPISLGAAGKAPIFGLAPLFAMKMAARRSKDVLDIIELSKIGKVSIGAVSERLSRVLSWSPNSTKMEGQRRARRTLTIALARSMGASEQEPPDRHSPGYAHMDVAAGSDDSFVEA